MTPSTHSLAKSSLAYAKLTATPTDTAWSQVYNAGNLFACLSLTLKEPQENPTTLQNLGKELFNNLEAEFFTLEEKNRQTITDAITKSAKHVPDTVIINFCLAYVKDTILYLFLQGQGRVIMKRGDKTGVLLEKKDHDISTELLTASGYLHNNDTIIIASQEFTATVPDTYIQEALELELPNDIAESLSIDMHKHADGAKAAIIIAYHGASPAPHPEPKEATLADIAAEETEAYTDTFDEEQKESLPNQLGERAHDLFSKITNLFYRQTRHIRPHLNHRKKLFLSVTLIILFLLVISIVFTKQKQQATQDAALFASIYDPALKKYDEGKALLTLNADTSREDLLEAERLLKEGQNKFSEGSKEAQQIAELLAKVQASLGGNDQLTNTIETTKITVDKSSLLGLEKATSDGAGFSQNDENVYYVTRTTAFAVSKSTGEQSELIENDDNWEQAVAIVPYQSNFYILDQKDGVIKFVPSGDSYSSSDYFTSAPNLSKAVSMAIDSSIWILFSDGTIKKYTRGEEDAFTIKELNKPLAQPTKIYTDPDITTVYILDNGNSRIVQLTNDGKFQKEYVSGVIKQAKNFEVLESEGKIRVLSGGDIWELSL